MTTFAVIASAAPPRRCLDDKEKLAEQVVRHGIFLREASRRCDQMAAGTKQMWDDFDRSFGSRLAQKTKIRLNAFKREFPDDWRKNSDFLDGRLVTYHRHFPLTSAYCENVKDLLEANKAKGWNSFQRQAKLTQDELTLDYKVCNPRQ